MTHALSSLAHVAALLSACAAVPPQAPGDVRDGTVLSADGVAIHFREGGSGDTALVFVHGWLGNASWWEPVMERFAATHRVVALDLAGHGRSGRERSDWTVERFADDVAAVVRALDLQRAVLVGHSFAWMITVEAARILEKRVVLLVPVSTFIEGESPLAPEAWSEFAGRLRADFTTTAGAWFEGLVFDEDSPELAARVGAEVRSADPASASAMLEHARAFDGKAAMQHLRVPMRQIVCLPGATSPETARWLEEAEAEPLPGIGHWPMLSAPDELGDALEQVLRSAVRP